MCPLRYITGGERKYYDQFFINGIMGIIKEWLKNDCRESPETIVELIMKCLRYRQEQ